MTLPIILLALYQIHLSVAFLLQLFGIPALERAWAADGWPSHKLDGGYIVCI